EPPRGGVELLAVPACSTPGEVREILRTALGPRKQRELVVDTFPGGLGGELDADLLASAGCTTLVRRYVKPLAYDHYDSLAARFDRAVLPYARACCEWSPEERVTAGRSVLFSGPLVRRLEVRRGQRSTL